jgi:hypothetical protein
MDRVMSFKAGQSHAGVCGVCGGRRVWSRAGQGITPDPQQLGAHFALMEAVSLLQHHVEQQLRVTAGAVPS